VDGAVWQPIGNGEYLGVPGSKRYPLYTRGNAGEVFPEVQYPLSFTLSWDRSQAAFRRSMLSGRIITQRDIDGEQTEAIGVFGGYSYLNLSMLRLAAVRVPGLSVDVVDQQYLGSSNAPPYVSRPGDKSFRGAVAAIRYAWKTMATTSLPQIEADRRTVEAWRLTLPNAATATDAELLHAMRESQPMMGELFGNHLIVSSQAGVPVAVLARTCERQLKDPSMLSRLLGGTGDVASAEPSTELWALGRMVAADMKLTAMFASGVVGLSERLAAADSQPAVHAFNEAFATFLSRHGCRGRNEWETACPTWGTDPELALTLVDRLRSAAADHDPAVARTRLVAERSLALAEADTKLRGSARKRLRKTIASYDLYAQSRERAKTTVVQAIHEMRLFSRELARRCSARSGGATDDLWFVTADELDAYVADPMPFAEVIAERRRMRNAIAEREPPFIVNGSPPPLEEWPLRSAPKTEREVRVGEVLTGMSGCSGVARGRARIVTDPGMPGDLGPGHVLIAPFTDPAWTPLFLAPEAVVVDVGATLSHAVIVSRELGTPSVVSVTGASRLIPHDALVEVDGTNGTVTILELP
jgi:rifampicin phosphotransferase